MKRYTLIFRGAFQRTRSMDVAADSIAAMSLDLDPRQLFVEHLIDWENQQVHSVALTEDGRLVKVTEGQYGEATSAGYFEDNGLTEPLTDSEEST